MDGKFKGVEELNAKQKTQQELEQKTQELYDIKSKMEMLKFPEGFKPISITKYKEVKLSKELKNSKGISKEDIYAIELENEEKERKTQLYILKAKELVLIAEINERNELLMELKEKEKYSTVTEEGELDEPYIINDEYRRELEKQKEAELLLEDRDQIEDKKSKKIDQKDAPTKEDSRNAKISKALGVQEDNILTVVEVKDEVTMSRVLNKNLETRNLYAVKLRQDSGGVGSNDWVIISESPNGEIHQAMKEDNSDTMQDIAQKLNMKGTMITDRELKVGDIGGVSQSWDGVRYYTINQYRFADNTTIVMLQTERDSDKSDIHFYKVENGKLIPICEEEHEHLNDNVPLNDEELEIVEEPEEEKDINGRPKGGRSRGEDAFIDRFGEDE